MALTLNANTVVHRSADPPLAAEVSFCLLHKYMLKKELNLLQLATGGVTNGAGSAKGLRGKRIEILAQMRQQKPPATGQSLLSPNLERGLFLMPALTHGSTNRPGVLSALQVCKIEISELTTAQTTAQQNGKNGRGRVYPFTHPVATPSEV